MAVQHLWVGGVTPAGAVVRGRITSGSSVTLQVSTSPAFSSPTSFGPVSPSADAMVTLIATGLTADTQYYYRLSIDSTPDTVTTGKFRTFPTAGAQASFTFVVSSCGLGVDYPYPAPGARVSNAPVFDTIRASNPLFFAHIGDLHYRDIAINDVALYRTAYNDVLAAPRQHQLYREVPIDYVWDDHDYGPDNSDRTSPSRTSAAAAYRERVPSYTLPDSAAVGIWHAFQVGRVQFVVTDGRSYRDPNTDPQTASKTLLGAEQKAWLTNLLTTSTAEVLVWLNPTPWMGFSNDTWAGFADERAELAGLFTTHGWAGRMCTINGDYHGLGMDTGSGNSWGGFPVYLFSSLDSSPGEDGETTPTHQYDTGPTSPGGERWGKVEITDAGTYIRVKATGYLDTFVWRSHTWFHTTSGAPPAHVNVSFDDVLSRVRIEAANLGVTADHATIERSVDGINWETVRGGAEAAVSGQAVTTSDYEFAAGVVNTYRVTAYTAADAFVSTAQASITPELLEVWLKSLARPFLNRKVTVTDFSEVSRAGRSGVAYAVGRSQPAYHTELMTGRAYTLSVLAGDQSTAQLLAFDPGGLSLDAGTLETILAFGDPVFVHAPAGAGFPSLYAVVGDVTIARTARRSGRRVFALPLTECAPPGPDVAGSAVNWQAVISAYATWQLLLDDLPSWQDVLDTIATPGDVVVP